MAVSWPGGGTEDRTVECINVLRMWRWDVVMVVNCGKGGIRLVKCTIFSVGGHSAVLWCITRCGGLLAAPFCHIVCSGLAASVVKEQLVSKSLRYLDGCSIGVIPYLSTLPNSYSAFVADGIAES